MANLRFQIRIVPLQGGVSRAIVDTGLAPRWMPDGKRIGFIRAGRLTGNSPAPSGSGRLELCSVKPDGTDCRLELTDSLSRRYAPFSFCWSPDGRSVAWVRNYPEGYGEVVVHDFAAGRERQLTADRRQVDEVTWTSNDNILFISNRSGTSNLWVVPAGGGEAIEVTQGTAPVISARISFDCKKLVYFQDEFIGHIWSSRLEGTNARQITFDDIRVNVAAFSPDGRQVAGVLGSVDVFSPETHLYTITEQVVRMLHPRPRTLWSRWLETFEAVALEKRFSKVEVLEFYLNQVPYARQRRGVAQAARLYFERDLNTLDVRETLALAVLVRAPATLDLLRDPKPAMRAIRKLADRMRDLDMLSDDQYCSALMDGRLSGEPPSMVDAGHFVQHLYRKFPVEAVVQSHGAGHAEYGAGKLVTSLDGSLQERVQRILDRRLKDLGSSDVTDGAVLVVDHQTDEVLAWVNGGGMTVDQPGGWIDAVTTPRQPGSTLKPFLYALALEMGWTPATLIDDSPLAEPVAGGLHDFRNYSRTF